MKLFHKNQNEIIKFFCEEDFKSQSTPNKYNSVVRVIFNCENLLVPPERAEKFIADVTSDVYKNDEQVTKFFQASTIFFKSDGMSLVGEYKGFYWIASQDCCIYFAGKNINELITSTNGNFNDIESEQELECEIETCTQPQISGKAFIANLLETFDKYNLTFNMSPTPTNEDDNTTFIELVKKDFGFDPFNVDEKIHG